MYITNFFPWHSYKSDSGRPGETMYYLEVGRNILLQGDTCFVENNWAAIQLMHLRGKNDCVHFDC